MRILITLSAESLNAIIIENQKYTFVYISNLVCYFTISLAKLYLTEKLNKLSSIFHRRQHN